MTVPPILVWFRQDLRISDHAALGAAAATGAQVIPLYILDDATPKQWRIGGASRWWLHESLKSLDTSLRAIGSRLVLAEGPTLEVLNDLIQETGARSLFWSRSYEPWAVKLEREIHRRLEASGVRCRRFSGSLMFEPEDIRSNAGEPYKVFTPFYKACLAFEGTRDVHPAPAHLPPVPDDIQSDKLEAWELQPTKPNWAGGLAAAWTPGEAGAQKNLDLLLEQTLGDYPEMRDVPGVDGTSHLSPHLHFGEISPRQIWNAVGAKGNPPGGEAFLRQLIWRDFSHHLLFHWPHFPDTPFRNEFSKFPWLEDDVLLGKWQRGETGIPIVDAGMRELWSTGWMHNRVRMITASFLVKHLLIPWQQGAAWFWDTLVDADLANNSASWQWVAGCGVDAAPYFRIFNPVLQGKKFDTDGAYVRAWVPELSRLPDNKIHEPWKASPEDLQDAKITLGQTYPEPIIDLAAGRERALAAYKEITGEKE